MSDIMDFKNEKTGVILRVHFWGDEVGICIVTKTAESEICVLKSNKLFKSLRLGERK